MGYVTREEVECKSCGRIIRRNELQYDSPQGRICVDCYKAKQPRQTTPIQESKDSWWSTARAVLVACFIISSFIIGTVLEYDRSGTFNSGSMILGLYVFFFVAVLCTAVLCYGLFIVLRSVSRRLRARNEALQEKVKWILKKTVVYFGLALLLFPGVYYLVVGVLSSFGIVIVALNPYSANRWREYFFTGVGWLAFFGFLIAVFANKRVGNLFGRLIGNVTFWKVFVGVGCAAMICTSAYLCIIAVVGTSYANEFEHGFFVGPVGLFFSGLIILVFFSSAFLIVVLPGKLRERSLIILVGVLLATGILLFPLFGT